MRFSIVSDNCDKAVTFVDSVSGRSYIVMGDIEDFFHEELRFMIDLMNAGDRYEQEWAAAGGY